MNGMKLRWPDAIPSAVMILSSTMKSISILRNKEPSRKYVIGFVVLTWKVKAASTRDIWVRMSHFWGPAHASRAPTRTNNGMIASKIAFSGCKVADLQSSGSERNDLTHCRCPSVWKFSTCSTCDPYFAQRMHTHALHLLSDNSRCKQRPQSRSSRLVDVCSHPQPAVAATTQDLR